MMTRNEELIQAANRYRKIKSAISNNQTILSLMADPSFTGLQDTPGRRARLEREIDEWEILLEQATRELDQLKNVVVEFEQTEA